MIRQAHTYLAGAVSGTALIGVAVVAFVLLVSAQALRGWDLPLGLGGGDSASVSPARPATGGSTPAAAVTAGGAGASSKGNGGAGEQGDAASPQRSAALAGGAPGTQATPVTETPGSTAPSPGAGGGGSTGGADSSPAGSTASPSSGGGNGGGGGSKPAGPGGGSSDGGGAGSAASSPSGTVTSTVNDTVAGVDEVTGGALGQTGVTKVTEGVVNGVAGPESVVGETVDKTVESVKETVGGLLGGGR